MSGETIRIGLICVRNAGRSQMALAFAERERAQRGLADDVELVTGGTDPADAVHDVVLEAMEDAGCDLSTREPRLITTEEVERCDYVATMGCSTLALDAETDVDVRDWALEDPDGADLDRVREIREDVRKRVSELFDEIVETHSL